MSIKGNKYGTHRVVSPKGVLTQAAQKIDSDMSEIYSNEILCDVISLNIDSASFAKDDWSVIAHFSKAIAAGEENTRYHIGDEKNILIGEVTYTFQILGFNHDDLSDDSGKAGITIGLKHLLENSFPMHSYSGIRVGWVGSHMRNEYLSDLLSSLPLELQSVIKEVEKETRNGDSIDTTNEKLWLFSLGEIASTGIDGAQYEYYKTILDGDIATNRVKYLSNGMGSPANWWLRTCTGSVDYNAVNASGKIVHSQQQNRYAICFGFCV